MTQRSAHERGPEAHKEGRGVETNGSIDISNSDLQRSTQGEWHTSSSVWAQVTRIDCPSEVSRAKPDETVILLRSLSRVTCATRWTSRLS